jgi:hypothetical protein
MGQSKGRSNDWSDSEVIFSLLDGYVWVSWQDGPATVRMGQSETVTSAMHDFLAQCELGERLLNGKSATLRPG